MGRHLNEKYLDEYALLDKSCAEKFDVPTGGVTEYINRLNNARFAPDRDSVLTSLIRYRTLRNSLIHDPAAMKRQGEVRKDDVSWLRAFRRILLRKKDPISRYLKKAKRFVRMRKFKNFLLWLLALILIAGILAGLYFYFLPSIGA